MAKAKTAAKPRMTLAEVMKTLEKAGSAQTRKTYARHGVSERMFGVSFATLKTLQKRIGVDHELALALWGTGNFDAQNLALKIADPAITSARDLDRFARENQARMCALYVASLAAEGPHAAAKAAQWLASDEEPLRSTGWALVGQMAARDEAAPDSWFADLLRRIEGSIGEAPNLERYAMNGAVIAIGGRSAALRRAALAAAGRLGRVEVDHGDTAQERARESLRTRC